MIVSIAPRVFARLLVCAITLTALPLASLAQEAAKPAEPSQLPPIEVTGKATQKKAPAKKSQAKAKAPAPKAAPQPPVEASLEPAPADTGVTNASSPVTDYVASDATVGTKTAAPLKETPQSISVVGKEQIRDQGVQNLQEALRYMPGVNADPYGYDSRYDASMVRGLNAAYFVDGLRTTYGFGYTTSMIEPYTLDRVEVLRGPSAMLYGQTPTGGMINAVSKMPSAVPYREVGVEYGSFDFKQVKLDMTGPLSMDGKWLYRVVGLARDADTQVDFVENDRLMLAPSITYRPTNKTSITVMGNFRDDHSGSTLQFVPQEGLLYPNRVTGERIGRSTFIGEPGDYYDTQSQSGTLIVDHEFSNGLKVHHASRYSNTETAYESTYGVVMTPARLAFINQLLTAPPAFGGFGLPDGIDASNAPFLNANRTEIARAKTDMFNDTDVFNTDTNLTGKFSTGWIDHTVTGGVDYTRFRTQMTRSGTNIDNLFTTNSLTPLAQLGFMFGGIPFQAPFDIYNPSYGQSTYLISTDGEFIVGEAPLETLPAQTQQQAGIYIQDQLKMGPWVALLGLRQDWLDIQQGATAVLRGEDRQEEATTGRAALLYNFSFGLSPYVAYSTSFAPIPGQPVGDTIETRYNQTRPAGPLEGEQIEVGFKYQPKGAPFALNASIYDLTESNQVIQPDFLFTAVQGADINVRGFEIEALGRVTPELRMIASYSYTEATYEKYPELYPFPSGVSEFMEGKAVDGVPKHQASFWAIYSVQSGLFRGLSFGGGVRYVGESESFAYDLVSLQEQKVVTPSFTLFDAMIAYETADWRWHLTGQNLEDEYHVTTCSAYRGDCGVGQARTIITGFTYKF